VKEESGGGEESFRPQDERDDQRDGQRDGERDGERDGAGLRRRHDGFTPERRKAFLAGLQQTGCVDDACRMARISDTTAYRTREKLPDFARAWNAALARAKMPLRALAWERATTGAEIKVIRNGKHVESRFKPSDSILRLLMQGAEPESFGRPFGGAAGSRGKVTLAQLDAKSRKQVRQEAFMEHQERVRGPDAQENVAEKIMTLVRAVKKRQRQDEWFENGGGV